MVATLDDLGEALVAEMSENTVRENLTPAEIAGVAEKLEAFEKAEAKLRQSEAGKLHGRGKPLIASSESDEAIGRADDKVAAAAGVGRDKLRKIATVTKAAKADPERFGDLLSLMESKSVSAAYRELRERQKPEPEVKEDDRSTPKQDDAIGSTGHRNHEDQGQVAPTAGREASSVSGPDERASGADTSSGHTDARLLGRSEAGLIDSERLRQLRTVRSVMAEVCEAYPAEVELASLTDALDGWISMRSL